ncbi:MAG: hypothetical protein KAS32_03080 [Candidatus Peribacteraceae bacterium]|nr:hypothetical protein [Candidatus Peribacteraceae bacterium]
MKCVPTNQGTAVSETALCNNCYRKPEHRRLARGQAVTIGDCKNPFGDFVDCTGNDAISCSVCGSQEDEVQLIASGYDWVCPCCEQFNRIIEITETVICNACASKFSTNNDPHHASG